MQNRKMYQENPILYVFCELKYPKRAVSSFAVFGKITVDENFLHNAIA
jgi:hypothetical protein